MSILNKASRTGVRLTPWRAPILFPRNGRQAQAENLASILFALHSPVRQFSVRHDFENTSFTLSAGAARLLLGAGSDLFCNGGAIAQTATLESAVITPFTVCLSVDLQAVSYSLALETGSGFALLGSTAVDSFTAGIRALRLSLTGDFALGAPTDRVLTLEYIWVSATPVPEPGTSVLVRHAGAAEPVQHWTLNHVVLAQRGPLRRQRLQRRCIGGSGVAWIACVAMSHEIESQRAINQHSNGQKCRIDQHG